jgi:hypothetical protein
VRGLRPGRHLPALPLLVAVLALVLVGALVGTRRERPTAAAPSPPAAAAPVRGDTVSAPCGWRTRPPARYAHVVWVVLENHSYEDVVGPAGSSVARRSPYLNSLARSCGLATSSWGLTHPSLPNYLAMVSGSTGGVRTSCVPARCPQHRRTLFAQLRSAGLGWRVYAESMPSACRRSDAGRYVVRHNPATYFPSVAADCRRWDVPMGSTSRGRLVSDLAADRLPSLSVVVPDQCNNTHDCPVATGDRWLARMVPRILASPGYRSGSTALVVTWDEGRGGRRGESCRATRSRSCHIATVVVSPTTRSGTRSATRFDHYALLETTERLLGLPLLGHAADAATVSMRGAFRL